MLPIVFEVPAEPAAQRILYDALEAIRLAYPGESGSTLVEPATDLGSWLLRIRAEVPSREPVYALLLDTLTAIDVWERSACPGCYPSIYDGLVGYEREPPGLEIWACTSALFARGFGDCEDLSADRTSEYIVAGQPARAALRLEERTPEADFWHVLVELPSGRFEDPSRRLGMN